MPKKKKDEEKALATRGGSSPLANVKPRRGLEEVDTTRLQIPRLHLCQDLSPQVKQRVAQVGDIVNVLSGKNYGPKVVIIPLFHTFQRIKWFPRSEGGGMECVARNGKHGTVHGDCSKCPHANWMKDKRTGTDKPPACTEYENFLVLPEKEAVPAILSMEKTKQAVARKFISAMMFGEGDIWDRAYLLSTVQQMSARKEPFFNYNVSFHRETTKEERAKAEALYLTMNARRHELDPGDSPDQSGGGSPEPSSRGRGKY